MKRFTVIMIVAMTGLVMSAQDRNVVSLHSISAQIGGLDYSYEQRLGGDFSMVFRAGFLPEEISVYSSAWGTQSFGIVASAGLAIEPRYYTNFDRRVRLGKTTYKNSADFVAMKIGAGLSGNGRGDEFCLNVTPMYGIRRVWGEHWFGEFTTGVFFNISEGISPGLHLQYRIGFVF